MCDRPNPDKPIRKKFKTGKYAITHRQIKCWLIASMVLLLVQCFGSSVTVQPQWVLAEFAYTQRSFGRSKMFPESFVGFQIFGCHRRGKIVGMLQGSYAIGLAAVWAKGAEKRHIGFRKAVPNDK
jgi:hypothetical protein